MRFHAAADNVLLYPTKYMLAEQRAELKAIGSPIIWLEKEAPEKSEEEAAAEPKK